MENGRVNNFSLLNLLQLVSPALPVGAYSYSEGLETLVEVGTIRHQEALEHWLYQELNYGAVRLEAAVMCRSYQAVMEANSDALQYWDQWLAAARETEELRIQSLQMGRSLLKLLLALDPPDSTIQLIQASNIQMDGCNFATAFAIAAITWNIDLESALLGYLHSWTVNLVNAGIKLIPLGQTTGQKMLLSLQPTIHNAKNAILLLTDHELASCGWGLALASMAHETQYSRLFRS